MTQREAEGQRTDSVLPSAGSQAAFFSSLHHAKQHTVDAEEAMGGQVDGIQERATGYRN